MLNVPALFSLAAVTALALAAAPGAAEPVCHTAAEGLTVCADTVGGPDAGGAGLTVDATVAGNVVHACAAAVVGCPGAEDGAGE